MTLFHFDVRYDDHPWLDDDIGTELRDIAEARKEACDLARGLAKDCLKCPREIAIRVRDEAAEPLMTLRLSLAIEERA
jgi:hypothetical protein